MSRSIDLPDSVCTALEHAAAAEGTTPAEWIAVRLPEAQPGIADLPRTDSENSEDPSVEALAQRFNGIVGMFRSGRGDLAERHSELFAEGMVEKRRMGRL